MKLSSIPNIPLLALLLAILLSGNVFAAEKNADAKAQNSAEKNQGGGAVKNIIFLIGDGMGLAHVSAAMAIRDTSEPLALERSTVIGLAKTSSSDGYVTDSAAGGTALASGFKTTNNTVGLKPDKTHARSILSLAREQGKATGVVVTVSVTHATPAAFVAHQEHRKMDEPIAADFIKDGPDIFIGGGRKFFEQRSDGQNLTDILRARDYRVAYTLDDVLATSLGTKRLAGLLSREHLSRVGHERGDQFPRLAAKALELLAQNPRGFVVMIEGSQIDWGGHNNDLKYLTEELIDFDQVVGLAMDFADKTPGTLVVVTADHETGGLSLKGGKLNSSLRSDAATEIRAAWGTDYHTATMVPVYAYGTGAEAFAGIYENTEIPRRMLKLLGLKTSAEGN